MLPSPVPLRIAPPLRPAHFALAPTSHLLTHRAAEPRADRCSRALHLFMLPAAQGPEGPMLLPIFASGAGRDAIAVASRRHRKGILGRWLPLVEEPLVLRCRRGRWTELRIDREHHVHMLDEPVDVGAEQRGLDRLVEHVFELPQRKRL